MGGAQYFCEKDELENDQMSHEEGEAQVQL